MSKGNNSSFCKQGPLRHHHTFGPRYNPPGCSRQALSRDLATRQIQNSEHSLSSQRAVEYANLGAHSKMATSTSLDSAVTLHLHYTPKQ